MGYELFKKNLEKLELSSRLKVFKHIFNLNILIYEFYEYNKIIILKFYDGDKYYQFNFVFNSNYCKMLKIRLENRIVVCDVYVENFLFKMKGVATKENNFYKFLEILSDVKMEDLDYFLRDDF